MAAMAVAYVAHVVVAPVVPHTFQILGQNMPEFCRNLAFFRKIYDTMLQGENQNGHGTSTEPDFDSFEVPV